MQPCQPQPSQPIPHGRSRSSCPAPPGGGTDLFGRQLAEIVEAEFKQKLVVENRAGGGGTVGVTQIVA
ncbi:MAG: hypothetical protein ACK5U4_15375, partial [Rhodospirillales bacterium]